MRMYQNIAVLALVLLASLALTSCSQDGRGPGSSPELTGEKGITLSFLGPAREPERIINEREQDVVLAVEAQNEGAYPEQGSAEGLIWLSGYDRTFMLFENDGRVRFPTGDGQELFARTVLNNQGGLALFEFTGSIDGSRLPEGSYEPTILANVCYTYEAKANPRICVDPDPYGARTQDKVCEAADLELGSQGGPVAVTKVEQTPLSGEQQFRITIENVGEGETLRLGSINNCGGEGSAGLERDDLGYVRVDKAEIGGQALDCRPLDGGELRLIEGRGYLICTIQKDQLYTRQNAYVTPLEIELSYGYKDTIKKPMKFRKLP